MSEQASILHILQQVEQGTLSADEALIQMKLSPFDDLGFAKVDHHRSLRQGTSEVIYGAGKTPDQIAAIAENMQARGQEAILITRMSAEAAQVVGSRMDLHYDPSSRIGRIGPLPEPGGIGTVVVLTAGTSDLPVAEEAAQTAEFLGNRVERLYDVGVAGIHRLLAHAESIMRATVIIAIAGMEGAIASVVGGLAALLSMLNSCASGVSVVNIDNGFGAGYLANMINHVGETHR